MLVLLLFTLACNGYARAQSTVNIPSVIHRDQMTVAGCVCEEDSDLQTSQIFWSASEGVDFKPHPLGARSQYVVAPPGQHTIETTVVTQRYQLLSVFVPDPNFPKDPTKAILKEIRIADGQAVIQRFASAFRVTGKPDPKPDDDDPPPDDAPFPSPGLAVLVIEEAQDRQNLPASQRAIWTDTGVRQFLRTNCADEGGRILNAFWDDDFTSSQLSGMPSTFRNAYPKIVAEANGNLPWVAISNGTVGYSGPLPKTVAEFMSLLRKYTPASGLSRALSDLRDISR